MIQISGGKSALWWEQKRQMSGGKSNKLGGGKSDKGKWYIAQSAARCLPSNSTSLEFSSTSLSRVGAATKILFRSGAPMTTRC